MNPRKRRPNCTAKKEQALCYSYLEAFSSICYRACLFLLSLLRLANLMLARSLYCCSMFFLCHLLVRFSRLLIFFTFLCIPLLFSSVFTSFHFSSFLCVFSMVFFGDFCLFSLQFSSVFNFYFLFFPSCVISPLFFGFLVLFFSFLILDFFLFLSYSSLGFLNPSLLFLYTSCVYFNKSKKMKYTIQFFNKLLMPIFFSIHIVYFPYTLGKKLYI